MKFRECNVDATPGKILEDGAIVTVHQPGMALEEGEIWIRLEDLATAERHGWKPDGKVVSGNIKVARE